MHASIAFVGAGPTTLYTLKSLLEHVRAPGRVVIFERQQKAGLGSPYRPDWNDPAMLSNIASVEIPPLCETLIDWLRRQTRQCLVDLAIDPTKIDERTFYPRVALGRYFVDQLDMLVNRARGAGFEIEVRTNHEVTDLSVDDDGSIWLECKSGAGAGHAELFDVAVMATGHRWPKEPEANSDYFPSPWPASALKRIKAGNVGIRGSSLTAIDAVVALATAHGTFVDSGDGRLDYRINAGSEGLQLTMMSRKGLLPEADFYHPIPYERLRFCTKDAMQTLIANKPKDLLGEAFALLKRELVFVDPAYAAHVGLAGVHLEDFAERFFADRLRTDPFQWAAANLAEAVINFQTETTVAWRYAILRMHEVFDLVAPHLSGNDLAAFHQHLKPVFVDEYATVPHLSVERLLALHRAHRLEVFALGDDYRIEIHGARGGVTVCVNGDDHHFDTFVDATGQQALQAEDFPFPMLLKQGVVRDAEHAELGSSRGISVDETFHPDSPDPRAKRLFCLSLPFILDRHPFVQGITSSQRMGEIVGAEIASQIAQIGIGEPKACAA